MFFKILKLFGLDVPAKIAEVRVDLDERVELAKDQINQAAQTAAVMAALFALASLAALAALGVGLIAFYSWVLLNYGQFYGFAAVGGVLLFVAVTIFASAMIKKKSWSAESANRAAAKKMNLVQVHAERVAAAAEAIEGPAILPLPPQSLRSTSSASDLAEPLTLNSVEDDKVSNSGEPAFGPTSCSLAGLSARRCRRSG